MAARIETPLAAKVSRAQLVARELEREISDGLAPADRLGTKDDVRRRFGVAVATVNEAQFPEFDGEALLAVHRDLVAAIDAGEGPRLDAAVAAHRPAQRLVGGPPRR